MKKALVFLAAVIGGCSSGGDGQAVAVSPPAGTGGAGGGALPFDPDAAAAGDGPVAAPYAIDGTKLGCTCKVIMNFTALATGDHPAMSQSGATLRVTAGAADGGVDAGADEPITVVAEPALGGGVSVVVLDNPQKSAVVVPPAGQYCAVIDYIPTTASVPTMRILYGGTREVIAGPAGGAAQVVLTPVPGGLNTVALRMTPSINSVRITPGSSGAIEIPAICFGTDAPPI
jgi:hypothetical protein